MNRPLAVIQLPATRTAKRTHGARTAATFPASSVTSRKGAITTPAAAWALKLVFASSTPSGRR